MTVVFGLGSYTSTRGAGWTRGAPTRTFYLIVLRWDAQHGGVDGGADAQSPLYRSNSGISSGDASTSKPTIYRFSSRCLFTAHSVTTSFVELGGFQTYSTGTGSRRESYSTKVPSLSMHLDGREECWG